MLRLTLARLCLVVPVALLSCNAGEEVADLGQTPTETSTTSQPLTTPPPMPTLQAPMAFQPGVTLFPSTVRTAYLVTLRDPNDPGVVYAFGFDVAAGTNLFVVKTNQLEQRAVADQAQLDIYRWKLGTTQPSHFNGGADGEGTTFKGPAGVQPHGPKAWIIAYNHYLADIQAQRLYP
jgi:hypothetical protein